MDKRSCFSPLKTLFLGRASGEAAAHFGLYFVSVNFRANPEVNAYTSGCESSTSGDKSFSQTDGKGKTENDECGMMNAE